MKNLQKQTPSKNPQTGCFLIEVGLSVRARSGISFEAYEQVVGRYVDLPVGANPVQVLSNSLPVAVRQILSDVSRTIVSVRFVPFPKRLPSVSYLEYRGRNVFLIAQTLCNSLLNQML